jgi:phage terminase Nu1 subunit (DNA packaging protein)
MAEIVEWTITQISENFGYDRREIIRILDEAGVEPVRQETNRKYYRLKPVFEACKFGSERLDLSQQKALHTMEMHRAKKRENDLEEGLVAPIDTIRKSLLEVAAQIGPIMDALPGQIKNIAPELTARDMEFIKKKISECKNSISEIKLEDNG